MEISNGMQQYGELLRTLLEKRGITDAEQAAIFFEPDYMRDFHDPFLMRDMDKAVTRIYRAIKNKEKIVIYADYDCDGIPGAVILSDLFKKINYENFSVYIPERNSEGYGLNKEAIEEFKTKGVALLITIDLGITATKEVELASAYGIDIIITDHHIPHATLPVAYAILNPKVDDYPEKMLCGAGVMFKLVCGFLKKYGEEFEVSPGWEKWLLDMAGLATLSDMVPLTGENRAIAYFGMMVLRKSPRPGLQKLLAQMKIDQRYLTEDDVGFMITPRLNAASRMDSPMRAFELLSTKDEKEAGALALHLTKINDERKSLVLGIMKEVKNKFEAKANKSAVIVIGNPSWRVGILGLVAGKVMDQYHKPVFVWGKDENDCIKGSCRSPGSVSVVELMTETKDHFLEFGGHELAGGFTVHPEKIHFLEDTLSQAFLNIHANKEDALQEKIMHDLKSDLGIVTMKSWRDINKLSPFGLANPKPVFLFESVKIENIKTFGKNGSGEHLEVIFSHGNESKINKVVSISFFSGVDSFKVPLSEGASVNLLGTFDLSRFRGREELRLRIVDIL